MLGAITSFIETVSTLVNFVIMTIESLITLILNIPTYLALLINSINVLPSFLLPFGVAFLTLSVVQYVLNRKADS